MTGGEAASERVFVVSRRQFARPAVELRVLLQMRRTPPVVALRFWIWPTVMVWSSSARKDSARACLRAEKAFFACASCEAWVRFVGLWVDFLGEEVGDVGSLEGSWRKGFFLGDLMVFWGECLSFQALTSLGLQKPSRLCLEIGGVGILVLVFEGDTRRDFDGDCGGGVIGLSRVRSLGRVARRGGENLNMASRFSLSYELEGLSSANGAGGSLDTVGSCAVAGANSLRLSPWNPRKASSKVLSPAFGFGAFAFLSGHSFLGLGSSSSDSSEPASEPHHTLSSTSISVSTSSSRF